MREDEVFFELLVERTGKRLASTGAVSDESVVTGTEGTSSGASSGLDADARFSSVVVSDTTSAVAESVVVVSAGVSDTDTVPVVVVSAAASVVVESDTTSVVVVSDTASALAESVVESVVVSASAASVGASKDEGAAVGAEELYCFDVVGQCVGDATVGHSVGSPGPGVGAAVGSSVGSEVGRGVRRTGAAVGVSGSSVGSGVSNSVLRVGEGVVGPKMTVGMAGKDGAAATEGEGVGGTNVGTSVGMYDGSGVGAVGSRVGGEEGTPVVGAGEANSDLRVGCGTVPSELVGVDVWKEVFLVGRAVGFK